MPHLLPQDDILEELCPQLGIELRFLSGGWIKELHYQGRRYRIYANGWDINGGGAVRIANDKAATSQVLTASGVPHLEHEMLHRPSRGVYNEGFTQEQHLQQVISRWGFPLVVKATRGFGAHAVWLAANREELNTHLAFLFSRASHCVVSPFVHFGAELRAICLDGEVLGTFAKVRARIVGNGQNTIEALAQQEGLSWSNHFLQAAFGLNHQSIPQKGQALPLSFSHNRQQGADLRALTPEEYSPPFKALATKACAAIGLRYCTVDITDSLENPQVIEINSSSSIKGLITRVPGGRAQAKEIYTKLLKVMVGWQQA